MMKILIAEDKPESLALLDSFLKKNNYQTYCAPNGKVALEILEKNKIDLIISDILMPDVDGYLFCKKVKSDPRWFDIPFIFYSATFTSRLDEIFAIKLGATRFVRKPINPNEFAKIITEVLQKYKKGTLEPARYKFKEEKDVFRLYNQRVVEKLEEKVNELEESENRYRILFETAAEGILIIDYSSRQFKYANPAICTMLGYSEKELLKLGFGDIHPPDKLPEIRQEFEALAHGQKSLAMNIPCQRQDGTIIYANFSINQITMHGVKYSVAFVTDTTEYKKATDALRSSEARLSTATKIAKLGYWEINNSDNLFTFDDQFYAIFHTTAVKEGGYKMSPAQYAKRFLHPDDQKMVASEMQKSLQATDPNYHRQLEHRIIYADGGIGWIAVNFFIKKDDQGRTIGAFGVNQDITARKLAEEEIRIAKQRMEMLVTSSTVMIYTCKAFGDFDATFISDNIYTITGYTNEEFLSKGFWAKHIHLEDAPRVFEDLAKLFEHDYYKHEYRFMFKDGIYHWMYDELKLIRDNSGNPLEILGTWSDITARKQAEANLLRSEMQYRTLTENSPDLIARFDRQHRHLYVNQSAAKAGRYSPEEYIGKTIAEVGVPENEARKWEEHISTVFETGEIVNVEDTFETPDGPRLFNTKFVPEFAPDGTVITVQSIARDITERKQAEEEYKQLINSMSETVWVINFEGKFVEVNDAAVKQLGYSREELLTMGPKDIDPNLSAVEINQLIEGMRSDKLQNFETAHRTKYGKIIPVEINSTPVTYHGQGAILSTARDITERKQAEENIRRITEGTHAILWHAEVTKMENESNGCCGFDWDTHYLNLENISNFIPLNGDPDIDLGRRYHNSILEEDRLRMAEISAKAFKDNAKSYEQEYRLQDANGTLHWMREHVDIDQIDDSHYEVTGIITDICELKRVQEALDLAVQSARVGLWNQDFKTGMIIRNAEWANMLGYKSSETESDVNFFYNLIHPDDLPIVKKVIKDHESGKNKFIQIEHRMRAKDGNWKWILNMGRVIEWDAKGKPLRAAGVHMDITERKQAEAERQALEAQLFQSQKMEAVGNLAGGIAHDFNNLLTIIQGHAQLMMADKNENDQEYHGLKQIVNAALRAAQLTRQLLLFSRKQEMAFENLNPNKTIVNLSEMLERLIGENIAINLQLDDNPWSVEADEGNLEQVIMNLAVNARDAMTHGGTLTIKTENTELTEQRCASIPQSRPGNFICLSMRDTGCGVPAEVIDKIFDPFFTTKEAGKGTGLGLSVVYGIIKKHNGWINVESEPGKGSIFMIYLPASQKSITENLTPKGQLLANLGKGEHILVIEDDDDVRKYMATILQQFNYIPYAAPEAATATDIFNQEKDNLSLIICDVVLPDKNGMILIEELLSTRTNIPVIMCSGYTNEEVRQDVLKKPNFRYLQKPIRMPSFLDLVQEILASVKQ
jgi:PAS domain S-box-containing protein